MAVLGGRGFKRLHGRVMVKMLCLLFLLAFPVACRATVQEGTALVSLMQKWNVNFITWTPGTDPCQSQVPWEGVNCTGPAVTSLALTNKGLQGPIPAEIGQLNSLTFLDLGNDDGKPFRNLITGELPKEFSALTRLQVLNLTYNPLMIQFPTVLLEMVSLQYLVMDHANLTGNLPVKIETLQRLVILYLGDNKLSGTLPAGLSKLSNLQNLSLWNNDFTAILPSEWGQFRSLTYLNLHDCHLYGGLPQTWSNLTNLKGLNLKNNLITGHIPDSWRSLTSLRVLQLEKNFISGALPSWLLTLPALQNFTVQQNQLQSTLPTYLQLGNFGSISLQCNYFNGTQPNVSAPFNATILQWNCFTGFVDVNDPDRNCQRQVDCLSFVRNLGAGNCPRCPQLGPPGQTPDPTTCVCQDRISSRASLPIAAIVGVALGALLLLLTAIAAFTYWKQRLVVHTDVFTTVGSNHDILPWEVPKDVHRYSFDELSKATNRFGDDHVIGAGGFGKVFYGTLTDGKEVAIKKASESTNQGRSEFRNEVALLSRLHHLHLVRLEGFCEDNGMQILVYEFMPNGNLHEYISGKRTDNFLTWYKRLEIAVGVAQGLEYLHSFADPPVIHRDVKPSNILLDGNFVAKVADFGISKVTPDNDTHVSTRPAGTAGFLDPEYFITRQLTTASDVYGFGVVLLELITGQQAIDHTRGQFNLVEWSRPRFEGSGIRSIIDPVIENAYPEEVFSAMADLALRCANYRKDGRPTMKAVLTVLEPLLNRPTSIGEPLPKGTVNFIGSLRNSFRGRLRLSEEAEHRFAIDGTTATMSTDSQPNMAASLLPR